MDKFTIQDLNLYYGDFHALKDVELHLGEKEITAFIGPSGCGKSTLLKTLNRMNDLVEGCRITGKVLLDEEHRWFTVTRARDLAEANPDILDFDAITGCRMDIDESRTELTREDADGKDVSYVPPRYEYSYDFFLIISVRHPYFDEMRFSLNSSSVYYEPQKLPQRAPMSHAPMDRPSGRSKMINASRVDPEDCAEYRKYRQMGDEICQALEQARSGGKQPAGAATGEDSVMCEAARDIPAAGPWTCPACGGNNQGKFCEYCGSPRP